MGLLSGIPSTECFFSILWMHNMSSGVKKLAFSYSGWATTVQTSVPLTQWRLQFTGLHVDRCDCNSYQYLQASCIVWRPSIGHAPLRRTVPVSIEGKQDIKPRHHRHNNKWGILLLMCWTEQDAVASDGEHEEHWWSRLHEQDLLSSDSGNCWPCLST